LNKTALMTVLPAVDLLLPVPIFTMVQAGFLLMNVWQNLPHMRVRVIEPPQFTAYDPEVVWWEFVVDKLQHEHMT
jgi:hypothetical protein